MIDDQDCGRLDIDMLVAGRYRIERVLGHGGFATVFLVQHEYLGQRFALKVSTDRRRAADGLLSEARLLARIHNPRIVRVLDAGVLVPNRCSYMLMEWIDGYSLEELSLQGKVTLQGALAATWAVANALTTIHELGILHRDLKPQNVLVPLADGRPSFGEAKVIDFSVYGATQAVAHEGQPHTGTGRVSGTVIYSAPEQLLGRRQSASTDIFGLGAILYRLCYHDTPLAAGGQFLRYDLTAFGENFNLKVTPERLEREVALPTEPRLPSEVGNWLQCALRRNPLERFQTACAARDSMAQVIEQIGGAGALILSRGLVSTDSTPQSCKGRL